MGAEGFHGRVRDGIGCLAPRYGHQAGQAPGGCGCPRRCLAACLVGGRRGAAGPPGGLALRADGFVVGSSASSD
jgi:hypothetical protein